MSINCTVTPGHTYGANYTVDWGDLNKLGNPAVVVPDGGTYAFGAGSAAGPTITFEGDGTRGFYAGGETMVSVAGQLGAADGMAGAPSLTFAADTTAGFYRPAAGILGVAGQLGVADGTAAAPGITFSADTDTGLYRTASNGLGIACGGASVATFSPSGLDVAGLTVGGAQVALSGPHPTWATFFTDFAAGDTLADAGMRLAGTATVQAESVMNNQAGDPIAFGVLVVTTGAEPSFGVVWPLDRSVAMYARGNYSVEWRLRLTQKSSAAQRYRIKIGIAAGTAAAGVVYFSGLTYCDSDGPQFCVQARNEQVATTSITADDSRWYRLRVVGTPTDTSFYVDGVLVHTFPDQIGSVYTKYYPVAEIASLSGSSSVLLLDWCSLACAVLRN